MESGTGVDKRPIMWQSASYAVNVGTRVGIKQFWYKFETGVSHFDHVADLLTFVRLIAGYKRT